MNTTNRKQQIISRFILITGSILCLFLAGKTISAYAVPLTVNDSQSWALTIGSIEEKGELHTTQYNTNYDGTIDVLQYDDVPSEGNCYAIVSVNATLTSSSAQAALDVSALQLRIEDANYEAVSPVSSFLTNHNYSTFPGEQIVSSARGYVAFEIPESYIGNDGTGWCILCGGVESPAYAPLGNSIETRPNYVESQTEREKLAIESYNLAGGATLSEPFVIKDLYGNAPLTAVAIFETQTSETVTVTVHGKDSSGDISYEINDAQTHHEIPIFGLYAGYENKVTLNAGGISSDIVIETQELPETIERVDKVGSYSTQQTGQLFVLQSPHQIIFDNNGDVRWYLTEEWSSKKLSSDSSYPMQIDTDDGSFWFCRNKLTSSSSNEGAEFIHMSWLGKVEKIVSSDGFHCDHDFTVVNDSTIYFIADGMSNTASIKKLNLETGKIETFLNLPDFLDENVLPSYNEAWSDLWHINSIQYLSYDNSFVISIRNQSLVAKIDAATGEARWIFTPASGKNDDGSTWARQSRYSDIALQPLEGDDSFEWFYNQHDANVVSYDKENKTLTLALFDNGTYRYNFGDDVNNAKYSRMVTYAIDENAKTATQVRAYGKERSSQLYSWWYGSARVLENDHFVGDFSVYNDARTSHIIEVDENSKLVAEYQVNVASCGAYRASIIDVRESFDNLCLGEQAGKEVHSYKTSYWNSCSLDKLGKFSWLSVFEIFRDKDTLSISGGVTVKKGQSISQVSMVLSGNKGTYGFDIIVDSGSGRFYGLGLPLSSLPDDTYSIYIKATASDGTSITQSLGKSITVGAAASSTVSTASNVPDESQEAILESLTASAAQSSFSEMAIVQNPFGISPLTAMALFSTDDLCSVAVTTHGKDSSDDVSYEIEGTRALHEVPIIGLYYNDTTQVTITLTHADGTKETKELSLSTGTAPNKNKISNIVVSYDEENASEIAPGLTFCAPSGGTYFYAIDKTGAIRWYYAFSGNIGMDGVSFTKNDHLLIFDGSKSAAAETNSFSAQEIDLLGRVYNAYFLPNMSFHHELKELSDGNLLCAATDYSKDTINDVIIKLNRETGEIIQRWDMDEILGRYGISRLATPSYELPTLTDESGDSYNTNWFHNNCVLYDESDDSLIVSSRHQSAVFKIDASTGSIKWVLSDPEGLTGTGLEKYLLTPVDNSGTTLNANEFEWQYGQHAPMICSDGDIALFDNGNYRTKLDTGRTLAPDNYSRVVKYHIDENAMTVSLVSEFGKELGSEHFCTLIGDVDELGENHYLNTFGGHCLTGKGGEVSDSSGAPYIDSSLYEVKDGKIIWQLFSEPNLPVRSSAIYRSERVNITSLAYTYDSSYGEQWLGDAGQAGTTELETSAFVEGLSNVTVTKATNEGNRIVFTGTVTNPLSVKTLYIGETYSGSEFYYKVDFAANGSFTAILPLKYETTNAGRSFKLYAVMSDDLKLFCNIDYATSGLNTFSAMINGDTVLSSGDSSSYTLTLSPSGLTTSQAAWISSNSDVLRIDAAGNAKALKPGISVLSVRSLDNGTRAQMTVTVTGASLSENNVTLRRGETYSLYVVSLGKTNTDVLWESSNEGIATVDSRGLIHAVEPGECTIYAKLEDNTLNASVKVTNVVDDGIYTIASRLDESFVIDISGGSTSDCANVQLYKDNASLAQQFRIEYKGGGKYTISSLCSDKVLDVQGAGMTSGTNVWQYSPNGTLAQSWYIDSDKNGYCTITSALNGLVLDVYGASKANGTNIQVCTSNGTNAQRFKLIKRFEDGIYRIESKLKSNLVLDIAGASSGQANVQVWTKNRSDAQLMLIRYAGEGTYEIRSLCSGYSLDITGGSMNNGANVQQYKPNGTKAQRWYLRANTDGSYRIISALSGKYLDVAGAGTSNGTNVRVWEGNGTLAQSFKLISAGITVTLRSAINPDYCLDIAGASGLSGANVQLYTANGTAAQKFFLSEPLAEGDRYLLPLTGFCSLDVEGAGKAPGTNVRQWQLNGTVAQRWRISYCGSGKYELTSVASGNALDVRSGIARNNQNVQTYTKNGTAAQRFIIE